MVGPGGVTKGVEGGRMKSVVDDVELGVILGVLSNPTGGFKTPANKCCGGGTAP